MSKVSKDTAATTQDFGPAEEWTSELDGYTVNFVTIKETHSLAPMLATLPGGHCSCPHWGYMLQGRMTVHFGDRSESYGPGDAFYMPPGHVPEADGGTQFVMFSPADELAATNEAVMKGMQAHAGG